MDVSWLPCQGWDSCIPVNQDEKERSYKLAQGLLLEQRFSAAVAIGVIAACFAAIVYGLISSLWGFASGFVAASIGIVVGISVQSFGKGIETKFAIVAAVCTIAGCFLGEMIRGALMQVEWGDSFFQDILSADVLPMLPDFVFSQISFVDLVFWIVSVWCAVYFATRPLSRSERLAIRTYELRE